MLLIMRTVLCPSISIPLFSRFSIRISMGQFPSTKLLLHMVHSWAKGTDVNNYTFRYSQVKKVTGRTCLRPQDSTVTSTSLIMRGFPFLIKMCKVALLNGFNLLMLIIGITQEGDSERPYGKISGLTR